MPDNPSIEVRSESVQDILEAIPSWMIRWGNTLFLTLLIFLLSISWFVKYPDVITAEVMLTTENPPEKVYSRITGQLEALLITDGQQVKAQQPLAVIENTALHKDVFFLKHILDTLLINKTRFYFPIEQVPLLILGDLNGSFANFENSYLEYQLNQGQASFNNESWANQMALLEAKTRLQNMKAQRELAQQEIALKQTDLERQKMLFDEGVVAARDYDAIKIAMLQSQKALESLDASISQTRELIGKAQTTVKFTDIEQSQNEIKLLKKTLQAFYQMKRDIREWESKYVLKSSIDGQASTLNVWNKHQSVKAGDLVFTVIPDNNEGYVGRMVAPPANSGKIKPGQKVQIRLYNYPEQEYGELPGKVKSMSLMANEEGQFLVKVAIADDLVTSYNKSLKFTQEMRGSADIVTEDLRLIERFFYQIRSMLG